MGEQKNGRERAAFASCPIERADQFYSTVRTNTPQTRSTRKSIQHISTVTVLRKEKKHTFTMFITCSTSNQIKVDMWVCSEISSQNCSNLDQSREELLILLVQVCVCPPGVRNTFKCQLTETSSNWSSTDILSVLCNDFGSEGNGEEPGDGR